MNRSFDLLRCVTAALAVAAVSGAQSGVKAATRALRDAVKAVDVSDASGARVVAAIRAVGAFDGAPGARALLQAIDDLGRHSAAVKDDRRGVLLAGGGSGRLKRSRYELTHLQDAEEAAADALDGMRDGAALEAMLSTLLARGSAIPLWLRLRLAKRLGELPPSEIPWRKRSLGKAGPDVLLGLVGAAEALGSRAGEACGGWLVRQLDHANPDVRAAAARALSKIAWPGGIEPMIARLGGREGDERERLLDALVVLTSQNPGGSLGSWRAWLAAEGAPYLKGERALSKGDASARTPSSSGATKAGSYFGIEQTGAGILYVFDNSLSMQAKLRGKAAGAGPKTGPKPSTRWEACKRELRRALQGLTPDKRFNLVSFANRARCFEASVQPATPKNVARAIEWVDGLELEFQTNVFDALELAFLLAGRGARDRYYEPTVDTMFFLSDGAPTIAKPDAPGITQDDSERILRAVAQWNALGNVRIHAIALGLQKRKGARNKKGKLWPYVFLERLAEQNRGRLVLVR